MTDLDALIEDAAFYGELSAGTDARWLATHGDSRLVTMLAASTVAQNPTPKAPEWMPDEEAFLRANYLTMSDAELGQALGRSAVGVHLRRERKLRLTARTKQDNLLTARGVADLLGVGCAKSVTRWIERGLLRGRTLPLDATIYAVAYPDLLRFAVNPHHWIYFHPERVTDTTLRRMIAQRRARWQDAWWTPGEVAAYHGVHHTCVNHHIRLGVLPAKRWGNWWILRSDATRIRLRSGSGNWRTAWTPGADAFALYGRAVGLSWKALERLCGIPNAAEHVAHLFRKGLVAQRLAQARLPVQQDAARRLLYVPYGAARGCFPFLDKAVDRFCAGRTLTAPEAQTVMGVWASWLKWHAVTPEHADLARRLDVRTGTSARQMSATYAQLQAWGFVW